MWDHLPVRNMIDLQRAAAYAAMGNHARRRAEGYAVEADRILDQMSERRRAWENDEGRS